MGRYSLKDRYVFITGGSSGIGKELSRCFAEEGAHCVLGALPSEKEALEQWVAELQQRYHVKAWPVPLDLSEDEGPQKLYQRVQELVPHVDVLVNNAGVLTYGAFHSVALERHEVMLRVNVRAYVLLMHLFLPDMIKRGEGRILNISSAAAFQPTCHHALYGATKAFVQSLSEAVRQEVKHSGVVVCTLNPSYTDTPMLKAEDVPKKLMWYRVSGLSDPATIAKKGVKALKKGKALYVPGAKHWFVHLFLPRVTPRRLGAYMSYQALKGVER